MLLLESFSVAFGRKTVFEDLNLELGEGKRLALLGPNGSGKSTLALSLAGVIPDFIPARVSGRAFFEKASLLMQNPSTQFFAMTVKEELGPFGNELAARFGMEELFSRNVFELSEGEKQKVNLVSALSYRPKGLLLDEPLELLDPVEASRFKRTLENAETAVVWLDKSDPMLPKAKKFLLGSSGKPVLPEPKSHASGSTILKAGISVKRNGFSLNAALSLGNGEKIAVIGRNGSGKSLLLKAIAGMERFSGSASLKMPVSFSPQNPSHLFFNETAEAELVEKKHAQKLGISSLLGQNPAFMSKGQQKLLSVAATCPKCIALLDEPTTWLDGLNKAAVYRFVAESRQPMVIATHDRQLLQYCDRVFLIEGGEARECSSTAANRFFRG